MPKPRNEWDEVANYMMALALEIKDKKKILLPPVTQQPSAAIESEVDLWFLNAAKTLKFSVYPPDELAPWIFVRLTCASAFLGACGDENKTSLPRGLPMGELMRLLMVDQWHAQLKDIWKNQPASFGDS